MAAVSNRNLPFQGIIRAQARALVDLDFRPVGFNTNDRAPPVWLIIPESYSEYAAQTSLLCIGPSLLHFKLTQAAYRACLRWHASAEGL